jgi:hypothetical protein
MLAQLAEYQSVATSVFARVTDCTSPGGAAKALIQTINDLNTELLDKERRGLDAALDVLQPAMAGTGRPMNVPLVRSRRKRLLAAVSLATGLALTACHGPDRDVPPPSAVPSRVTPRPVVTVTPFPGSGTTGWPYQFADAFTTRPPTR